MKARTFSILFIIITLFAFTNPVLANTPQEKVYSYKEYVKPNEDRSIDVTEEIKIYAEGNVFKHGMYRDIPTAYDGKFKTKETVNLNITSIQREGKEEKYHITNESNGKRIYIGDKDVLLSPGFYTYTISYTLSDQIRMFDNQDEIYHNVTGNGWNVYIDNVYARIQLPKGVNPDEIKTTAYTGLKGEKGENFTSTVNKDGDITYIDFKTTETLTPHEGLTVVVGFPKGYITEQSQNEKLISFIISNLNLIFSFLIFLVVSIYLYETWLLVGKDPEGKTIIPEYEVTKDMSPAGIRYIHKMDYDDKIITATLVNLAIQKIIKIEKTDLKFESDTYTITLLKDKNTLTSLTDEGLLLINKFFPHDSKSFTFRQSQHEKIQSTRKKLTKLLQKKYLGTYFSNNYQKLIFPTILLIINILTTIMFSGDSDIAGSIIWLIGWTIGIVLMGMNFIPQIKRKNLESIFPGIFFLAFLIPEVTMIAHLISIGGFPVIFLIGTLIITAFAVNFLRARTELGRDIEDKSLGLKLFLETVEERRYNSKLHKDIPESLKVYEKYLPYAIALNIEPLWTRKFEKEISQAKLDADTYSTVTAINYANMSSIGSFGNSLTSTISSSSQSPSSGGSGFSGGSSGGGGGGGGGGGW